MVAKLDALVRSQESFVADASHQLRTPLTALRLRLENLERHVGPERRDELEGTLAELERLSRLVDSLLTLARADRAAIAPVAVDVGALVSERVEAWSALAAERRVGLEERIEGVPAARATEGRLEQVLDNLLANALEASPEGGTIVVSAARAGEWVELHVADEGPGMAEEDRGRAFDRFWRADGSGEGFGLGLAIVQRLVAGDGGAIELRESPSGGLDAVMLLRVPRASAQ
jgi:signal transduction histidine kinase